MKTITSLPFFFLLILMSCSKEPTEFYSKEDRERIGAHEPNILFSNYHLLEADKYIELKSLLRQNSKPKFVIECSFLKGQTLEFQNQFFLISEHFQTIPLSDFNFNENEMDLSFKLNDLKFSFPKTELMILEEGESLLEIGVGSEVKWKESNTEEKIVLAIRPNHKDCGKKNTSEQSYGTRPRFVEDDGIYNFQTSDFRSIGLDYKNEVSILFKRGNYEMMKFVDNSEEQNICISNLSAAVIDSVISKF